MKWKWGIRFFFCMGILCLAYCYDYQKTMYELERRQIEQRIAEQEDAMPAVRQGREERKKAYAGEA